MFTFHYLVILDFEATCQENEKLENQEIIEFPSVLLDAKTMQTVDTFREYVKPVYNPQLTPFCKQLTGIQQEWVDNASTFQTVLNSHRDWLLKHKLILENTYEKNPEIEWTFVTCGEWDCKTMLPAQCKITKDDTTGQLLNLPPPSYFNHWANIKWLFEGFYKKPSFGMSNMLQNLNLELLGRHHSGLDDCINIARIACKMIKDGCTFKYTSTTVKAPKGPKLSKEERAEKFKQNQQQQKQAKQDKLKMFKETEEKQQQQQQQQEPSQKDQQ